MERILDRDQKTGREIGRIDERREERHTQRVPLSLLSQVIHLGTRTVTRGERIMSWRQIVYSGILCMSSEMEAVAYILPKV